MKIHPIGHVVATELKPNTAYSFCFWAKREANLGVGSMVKVALEDATVFGTIVEAQAYNDLPGAMADFLGSQGEPGGTALTARPEIRFFEAAVLRRVPEEPVAAVGIGPVYEADAADLRTALRGDRFEGGIPVGVYGSKEHPMPVLADPQFLLGPEAGHLNVTGTSGLAAKTSYIQFLLQSIFQKYSGEDGVAAVLFNVKGGDLLYLDQPQSGPLPEQHGRMYAVCGLEAKPFDKVTYWAQFADETQSELTTLRNHAALMERNPTRGFCYGLKEVLRHAEVLLNRDDLDAKADAFLAYLEHDVAGRDSFRVAGKNGDEPAMRVRTLREVVSAVRAMLAYAQARNEQTYRSHHVATIQKMENRLNGFALRFQGLVSETGDSRPPLPEQFEDRTIHVVDVSKMDSDGQDLVFAAIISDLRDRMEQRSLGVGRLIVVVDELNKYAPSAGRDTYIAQSLRDIAARGRYLGLVLFGAQQFRSRVDAQIVGNCANSAYGHVLMEELANPIYTVYSQAVREKLATADPGEMMIRHPHFTQPVFIRFPLPSILRGPDGMKMFPAEPSTSLEERVVKLAVKKGNGKLTPAAVKDELAKLAPNEMEESLKKICRELATNDASRTGALEIIRKHGKRAAPSVRVRVEPIDDEDPFRD